MEWENKQNQKIPGSIPSPDESEQLARLVPEREADGVLGAGEADVAEQRRQRPDILLIRVQAEQEQKRIQCYKPFGRRKKVQHFFLFKNLFRALIFL
jgi:hypothetical protein